MHLLLSDKNCEINYFFQTDNFPANVQSEDVEHDAGMTVTVTETLCDGIISASSAILQDLAQEVNKTVFFSGSQTCHNIL